MNENNKNIILINKTSIRDIDLINNILNIHESAIIHGMIKIVVKDNIDIKIHIGKNAIIEHNSMIELFDSSLLINDGALIGSNCLIQCNNSDFTMNQNSKTGFCDKFFFKSSSILIGNKTIIGDFVKLFSIDGTINIKNKCNIGDYSSIKSKPGLILINDNVRIDERNELVATGNIIIGEKSHFWNGSYVASFDKPFIFATRVTLGQKCIIAGRGELIIEDDTMIGGASYIVTENHICERPFTPIRDQFFKTKGVYIGKQSWISAHCTILDGVHIGHRTVVGAGAVVNKNISSYKLALGVPAKTIKDRRDSYLNYTEIQNDNSSNLNVPNHFLEWLESSTLDEVESLLSRVDKAPISDEKKHDLRNIIQTLIRN